IKVLLTDSEGKIYEGIAKGTASPQSRLSTTASATINAIQLFVGDSFVISLDDVHVFYIGNVQAVSILISVLTPEKDEQLLGGALVKHDIYEAGAQAVLSALNRRISFLIKE
ncbi:MAG: hypothetical protein GX892_07315, partial [Thermoanaerobacteraceae bacterium]|nr:hypothetical protein [Thermoanaerobacteraceae bacterium]